MPQLHKHFNVIGYISNMRTDWTQLGIQLGLIRKDGESSGGDKMAEHALETVLGQEWIESAVEHIVSFRRGSELAMNCLRLIKSKQAVEYAYQVYKTSSGDRAAQAVWLIKHITHPVSFNWIEEFLNDPNVLDWGIGVLDQLLWTESIPYDEKANALLVIAENKGIPYLTEQVDFIRTYIQEREQNSR